MEFKRLEEKKTELEYYKKTDQISDNDLELLAEIHQALQLLQTGVNVQLCGNLDENYNCKNMCLTHCINGDKFYK